MVVEKSPFAERVTKQIQSPAMNCVLNTQLITLLIRRQGLLNACLVTAILTATGVLAADLPVPQTGSAPKAPPPAPPIEFRASQPGRPSPRPQGPTLYSI